MSFLINTSLTFVVLEKKKPKVEQKSVNAADVFGSGTVKRTARKTSKNVSYFTTLRLTASW